MAIKIKLNDQRMQLDENLLATVLWQQIPDFMKDATVPAPDAKSDLMRGMMKSAWVTMGNQLLFNVYGANAPKPEKRADKLPIMWCTMIDYVIARMKSEGIQLYATQDTENGEWIIKGGTSIPVDTRATQEVATDPACAECEPVTGN